MGVVLPFPGRGSPGGDRDGVSNARAAQTGELLPLRAGQRRTRPGIISTAKPGNVAYLHRQPPVDGTSFRTVPRMTSPGNGTSITEMVAALDRRVAERALRDGPSAGPVPSRNKRLEGRGRGLLARLLNWWGA